MGIVEAIEQQILAFMAAHPQVAYGLPFHPVRLWAEKVVANDGYCP